MLNSLAAIKNQSNSVFYSLHVTKPSGGTEFKIISIALFYNPRSSVNTLRSTLEA